MSSPELVGLVKAELEPFVESTVKTLIKKAVANLLAPSGEIATAIGKAVEASPSVATPPREDICGAVVAALSDDAAAPAIAAACDAAVHRALAPDAPIAAAIATSRESVAAAVSSGHWSQRWVRDFPFRAALAELSRRSGRDVAGGLQRRVASPAGRLPEPGGHRRRAGKLVDPEHPCLERCQPGVGGAHPVEARGDGAVGA